MQILQNRTHLNSFHTSKKTQLFIIHKFSQTLPLSTPVCIFTRFDIVHSPLQMIYTDLKKGKNTTNVQTKSLDISVLVCTPIFLEANSPAIVPCVYIAVINCNKDREILMNLGCVQTNRLIEKQCIEENTKSFVFDIHTNIGLFCFLFSCKISKCIIYECMLI